jgi:hypothetical protein
VARLHFEEALGEEGHLHLLVTGQGAFPARLTQIALHHLRLSAGEEQLPRIALVAVPAEMILVALPVGDEPMPVWGGIGMRAGEIMTVGAGRPMHMRTDGPCRWGLIWLPAVELARYGSAMTGATFSIPSATRWWRLRPATTRYLRRLHSAAVGHVESGRALMGAKTAHGLEQQLIEALVECLSKERAIEALPETVEHQDIAARFEALLQTQPGQSLPMAKDYVRDRYPDEREAPRPSTCKSAASGTNGLMLLLLPRRLSPTRKAYLQAPAARSAERRNRKRSVPGRCLAPSIQPDFW